MEESSKIERSELWTKIHDIVKQIPRAKIAFDAADAPSVATELEGLFLKNFSLGGVSGILPDNKIYDLSELPSKQKKEMIEVFTELTCKHALQLFMSLGLKTHIEAMVVNDTTNDEFILTFKKVQK